MALSKEDRISISKKIIDIPKQNEDADNVIATMEGAKLEAIEADNSNKALMDGNTVLIDEYQKELGLIDGNDRAVLVEQDIQDASNKVFQNFFFPNDLATPLPSVPDGVWKSFPPFSGSVAIGKTYEETYSSTIKEQDETDPITSLIISIEAANTETNKTTGEEATEVDLDAGFCTPPSDPNTEAQCLLDVGVWTSEPTIDEVIPKVDVQADIITLKGDMATWKAHLSSEKTAIEAASAIDTDGGRGSSNLAAIADIDATIAIIDAWDLLPDFYTDHGATTFAEFEALDPSTFPTTKLAVAELTKIKSQITSRNSFIGTRIAELISDTYLGSVTQDIVTGAITAAAGFYGKRFRIIDMRINLMSGSLSKVISLGNAQGAQGELKGSNASAEQALLDVISASPFRAPASGTATVHVLDGSLFSIGDTAYIIANTQEEIEVSIVNVQENTIFLDKPIPKKYRQDDGARLYKSL